MENDLFSNEPRYILAIDGSTSKVGYSVWDSKTFELVHAGGFKFKKSTLLEKCLFYEELMKTHIFSKYDIEVMCIEAPKISMMNMFTGREQTTNAKTLKVLSQINFGYQYVSFKLNQQVFEMDESLCKRFSYPNYKRKRSGSVKEQYANCVLEDSTLNKDLYLYYKIDKDGSKKVYDWVEDVIDSIIVGKAFINLRKEGLTPLDVL